MGTPMSRPTRILLVFALGFVGLAGLVALVIHLLVQAKVNKASLETTASQALGMEVRIDGPLRVSLFPGLLVTIEDVHLRSNMAQIASARQAELDFDLLALLRNEVRIKRIALRHPKASIEWDHDGRSNLEELRTAGRILPDMDWPVVSLSDASLVYLDQQLDERFEAEGCDVTAHDLRLTGGKGTQRVNELSLTADLACREVRGYGVAVTDLKFSGVAKNGAFDFKALAMRVFGAPASGSIRIDLSPAVPAVRVEFALPQFQIEEFLGAMSLGKLAAGRMDFAASLSLQGATRKAMRQSLAGQISLRGSHLTLVGSDLDRQFARFESTQALNLVDVGAFFFVGPLGLVVTKGISFASVLQESSGSSEIRTLVSDWKVERGVAQAHDVAMATKENRIALRGGLDFVGQRFNGVTVALIDAKGCAKVRQDVHGTFRDPVVEKPGLLTSLAGPALRLLRKGSELLGAGQCEVFYAGSVPAPS